MEKSTTNTEYSDILGVCMKVCILCMIVSMTFVDLHVHIILCTYMRCVLCISIYFYMYVYMYLCPCAYYIVCETVFCRCLRDV